MLPHNGLHYASIVTKIQCKKPLIRANLILSDPELEGNVFSPCFKVLVWERVSVISVV